MSIHDKLAALGEELHLTGFGSELTEGVKRLATLFADELHALEGKGDLDPAAIEGSIVKAVEAKVEPFLEQLQGMFAGKITELEASIEGLKQNLHAPAAPPAEPPQQAAAPAAAPEPLPEPAGVAGAGATGVGTAPATA